MDGAEEQVDASAGAEPVVGAGPGCPDEGSAGTVTAQGPEETASVSEASALPEVEAPEAEAVPAAVAVAAAQPVLPNVGDMTDLDSLQVEGSIGSGSSALPSDAENVFGAPSSPETTQLALGYMDPFGTSSADDLANSAGQESETSTEAANDSSLSSSGGPSDNALTRISSRSGRRRALETRSGEESSTSEVQSEVRPGRQEAPDTRSGEDSSTSEVQSEARPVGATPSNSGVACVPGRALRWQTILLDDEALKVAREQRPFSNWVVDLTETNQRVIHADCERTRADTAFFRQPAIRQKMESMLTCWCKLHKTGYKQGLNEALAPFMFLQTEPGGTAPDDDMVFVLFSAFLNKYVPFFYDSDDFVALQCAFVFFKRLLLYHHPDLHNLLMLERNITADMFCTPWFLTLFASKTPLRVVLYLWDRVIERGDPVFFVFLAVAFVASAQLPISASDGCGLPEILSSMCLTSREEMESVWITAESMQRATPATFAARLRRHSLRPLARDIPSVPGKPAEPPARRFERLEQEKYFFILPEEVVGHCYPPKPGEARQPWHPVPLRSWRLIILDLRSLKDFEAGRLPAAIHFDPSQFLGGGGGWSPANASAGSPASKADGAVSDWFAGRRLLQWGTDHSAGLDAARVFDALKCTLGENWVCDRDAHICLLGSADDAALLRSLYELLTQDLTLRHVSVASGGFEAVLTCARRNGCEIIRTEESCRSANEDSAPMGDVSVSASSAVTALSTAAFSATSKFNSAWSSGWSSIRKAAGGYMAPANGAATANRGGSTEPSNPASPTPLSPRSVGPRTPMPTPRREPGAETADHMSGNDVAIGRPQIRPYPGNWPIEPAWIDDMPTIHESELASDGVKSWPCIAVSIRRPSLDDDQHPGSWAGCWCTVALREEQMICCVPFAKFDPHRRIIAELPVSRLLRVSSKKQMTNVLNVYFLDEGSEGASASAPAQARSGVAITAGHPTAVLYFTDGIHDEFIRAISGLYARQRSAARARASAMAPMTAAPAEAPANTTEAATLSGSPMATPAPTPAETSADDSSGGQSPVRADAVGPSEGQARHTEVTEDKPDTPKADSPTEGSDA